MPEKMTCVLYALCRVCIFYILIRKYNKILQKSNFNYIFHINSHLQLQRYLHRYLHIYLQTTNTIKLMT